MGLESTVQWFTYDLGPAQRALQPVLVASAIFVARPDCDHPITGDWVDPPGGGVLSRCGIPRLVTVARKLYRRDGKTRTANVIGRRGVTDPRMTLMLMAHHDSKSQSLSFPFRMGLTIITLSLAPPFWLRWR